MAAATPPAGQLRPPRRVSSPYVCSEPVTTNRDRAARTSQPTGLRGKRAEIVAPTAPPIRIATAFTTEAVVLMVLTPASCACQVSQSSPARPAQSTATHNNATAG